VESTGAGDGVPSSPLCTGGASTRRIAIAVVKDGMRSPWMRREMVEWSMPQRIAKTRCETRLAAIISWSQPPKSPSATRGGISKSPTVLIPCVLGIAPQGSGRSSCAGVTHVPCRQHAESLGVHVRIRLYASLTPLTTGYAWERGASRLQIDLSDLTQLWQASSSTGTTSSALQRQGDGGHSCSLPRTAAGRRGLHRLYFATVLPARREP
jgi:hypothetical protein